MKLLEKLKEQSVVRLVRLACYLALLGLAIMAYSIVEPRALPVIFAMSVGHAIGVLALLCYLVSIVLDLARVGRAAPSSSRGISRSDET